MLKRLALSAALVAALSACQKQDAPAPATAEPAPAAAPAVTSAEPTMIAPAPATAAAPAMDPAFATRLDEVLAGAHRSDENKARDTWRHPKETLAFFGLAPGMTVIEMNPGGGWYTEILAPALNGNGTLITAVVDPAKTSSDRAREYNEKANADLRAMLGAKMEQFGPVQVAEYDPAAPVLGMPGSADMVVTFRNIHGWVGNGNADKIFAGFFDALKPGGVLGIEQHRAPAGSDPAEWSSKGYVPQEHVVALATAAGFLLEAESEINANPADTKDHPGGVWNLSPNLSGHETDEEKAKYAAIGESDRMTLRFRKPAG
jgi:predicted methyltransferase